MLKIEKIFFYLGVIALMVAIEFFVFSSLSYLYLISGFAMSVAGALCLYVGRLHFVQIAYRYKYKGVINEAQDKLDKLNIEIEQKTKLYDKLNK